MQVYMMYKVKKIFFEFNNNNMCEVKCVLGHQISYSVL